MLSSVSIVIPVYNIDKNLFQLCIKSVMDQTFKDFEVIFVDDGSTDTSGELCDKFAKEDSRVRVIHQKNQGVGAARNNGTAQANGKYIMYVDADDRVAPYMLEEAFMAAKETGADMVMAAIVKMDAPDAFWDSVDTTASEYTIYEKDSFDLLKKHYAAGVDRLMRIKGEGYINRGPYSRMIVAEIAKKVPFPEGLSIGEDYLWNMDLLSECEKVCVVNNIWYGYLKHSSSAFHGYHGNRERVVSLYLKRLLDKEQEFFKTHMNDYAKSVATEFYCMLNYELLSDECDMTKREKKQFVRQCLLKEPWNLLKDKELSKELPYRTRGLLALCPSGMWLYALGLRKCLYKWKTKRHK